MPLPENNGKESTDFEFGTFLPSFCQEIKGCSPPKHEPPAPDPLIFRGKKIIGMFMRPSRSNARPSTGHSMQDSTKGKS